MHPYRSVSRSLIFSMLSCIVIVLFLCNQNGYNGHPHISQKY
jgi:hypothetical protein